MDSNYFRKKLKNARNLEKKTETFKKQVRATNYIRELSEKYDSREIDQLVDTIVRKKVNLLGNAEYLSQEWDEFHLQYVEYAHRLLELILRKKLFNLELQWRAEEITLPGVEITRDFQYWAADISNCPFLDPITDREVEVLKMFMQSNNFEIKDWSWDTGLDYDFEAFMRKNPEGDRDQLPEFYEYYDGLMGTFYLLNKQDYREEKEARYIRLLGHDRQKKHEKRVKKVEAGLVAARLPYFNPHGADGNSILKQTEPEDFQELLEAMDLRNLDGFFNRSSLQEMVDYFRRNRDQDIRLPGWLQWDEAMEKVYNQHRNERALEVLDLALEEYRMKAEMGLFNTREVEKKKKKCIIRQFIRKGRKLAGEAGDFDF